MTEKKTPEMAKKKVYKKPEMIKSVKSGQMLHMICTGCGSQVFHANSHCGH